MPDPPDCADTRRQLRLAVYWLLIITAAGSAVGRIFAVRADHGKTPMLSANDRSRWCTIRALVDHGTYAIDQVVFDRRTGKRDRYWYTIDMVRHKGRDGREHYYSSKPTLLPTLLAGPYWLIKQLTGADLKREPFYVVRLMLILINVLPLLVYLWLIVQLVEQYGQTDWGRLFVMASAAWGTFLTTFCVTLNNHLPAAIAVLVAAFALLRIWHFGGGSGWYALAGLAAAFAAANELPSLSLLALVAAALLWHSPRRTAAAFLPAVAVVAAGFFVTNYLAHQSWRPAYAHRRDGPLVAELPGTLAGQLQPGPVPSPLRAALNDSAAEALPDVSPAAELTPAPIIAARSAGQPVAQRWCLWDPDGQDRLAILAVQSTPPTVHVRTWDNWYEYEGSYWYSDRKSEVDRGEPSRLRYAWHLLLGHHGIFSLTPLWLLAAVGSLAALLSRDALPAGLERLLKPVDKLLSRCGLRRLLADRQYKLSGLAAMVIVLSVVCIAFYIARPLVDRNYGGVTCGPRWLFWLIPLWLVCMLPAADAAGQRRTWRVVSLVLLLLSAVSASYGALNPWVHPWIYAYVKYLWG